MRIQASGTYGSNSSRNPLSLRRNFGFSHRNWVKPLDLPDSITGYMIYFTLVSKSIEPAGFFGGIDFITDIPDSDLATLIKAGRPSSDPANTTGIDMPSKGRNLALKDQKNDGLVSYIRSLQQNACRVVKSILRGHVILSWTFFIGSIPNIHRKWRNSGSPDDIVNDELLGKPSNSRRYLYLKT